MRSITLSLAGLLLASAALAQNPKLVQPVNLDPKNSRLDHHLTQWQQRMVGVESILCECKREDKDKASGFTKKFEGHARYLKPNYAALRMPQAGSSNYELYIVTGQYLYDYRPAQKTLRIYDLPPNQMGGNFQNNFLSFVFGMNAADTKRRYDLTLSKDVSADNPHYIYIEIKPKYEADKKQFTHAQLVLYSGTMLPRRLWFQHPNGDQVTWELTNIDVTTKLKPTDFAPPNAPKGWQTVRVPKTENPIQPASKKDGK